MPVPCSIEIFSSSVISLTTIDARSSGERLWIHPGMGLFAGLREGSSKKKVEDCE